jgi:hypothetical protein
VSFFSLKCKIADARQVQEYSQASAGQGQEISVLSRNVQWEKTIFHTLHLCCSQVVKNSKINMCMK